MGTPQAKDGFTFVGDLCEFNLGADKPNRRWIVVSAPFGIIRKYLKVEPYDPVRQRGEQRARIDSHVRKLKRVTVAGEYTPAPWAAGVRENHMPDVEIDEKRKKVKVFVPDQNPLACLDGGHRFECLEDLRREADREKQAIIDSLSISVTIYLDPKFIQEDFGHLQEGKAVSRSQLKFMREARASGNEKEAPISELARKVAWTMNEASAQDSFLSNDINFTGGGGGRVEYASITTVGGSDIGTSITGGAKICLYEGFKSFVPNKEVARDFLVNCYQEVWRGFYKYDEQEEWEDPVLGTRQKFPQLLMPGRMLRPNLMKGGATKMGTGLLIMLGNMLAFRCLAVRKKPEVSVPDVKRLIECAREVLDDDVRGGGGGPAKRQATGEFARVYFEDVVRHSGADAHDMKKLGAIDGIPTLLINILTRSTLDVSKNASAYVADDGEREAPSRLSDPDQTDSEWVEDDLDEGPPPPILDADEDEEDEEIITEEEEFEPPKPPARRGRPKKNSSTKGVMG